MASSSVAAMERRGAPESAVAIHVAGELAEITFDRFDLPAYELFLRVKGLPESRVAFDWRTDAYTVTTPARFAARLGVVSDQARAPHLRWIGPHLFDYHRQALANCERELQRQQAEKTLPLFELAGVAVAD